MASQKSADALAAVDKRATAESDGVKLMKAETRRKALREVYMKEEKVPMYLSPMYQPFVGKVMPVTINGISIFFKVDGKSQMIPKSFADEITQRRMAIDAIVQKQTQLSDIKNNYESSPGELKLF